MKNNTKLFRIHKGIARNKNIPLYFAANVITETERAVYLYGRGTTESIRIGICCICGRTLTHPVSVELGIGPECGGHYWDWNLIGGYNEANLERLKKELCNIKIDTWLPKSAIESTAETKDIVTTPEDHPMLRPKNTNPVRQATMGRYHNSGHDAIKIRFPYNVEDIALIKTLPDRKYHPEQKYWSCPLTVEAAEKLRQWKFSLDEHLLKFLEQNRPIHVDQVECAKVPGLKGTLFPFQEKGVAFIEAKRGRALIADEMGLGKTIQALAWLQLHPELRPAIIVVPASLKLNWMREAIAWMPNPKVTILSGTNPYLPIRGEIIIINYDILFAWWECLQDIRPRVLITDECHYYKNNTAKRTKAVKMLGKGIPHILALSGTPIVNRPIEAYNAIKLINPTVVGSYRNYGERYCDAKLVSYGGPVFWDFSGATNTQELHNILTNTIMIRRKKEDVLKELPDKMRSFVPMELDNEAEYHEAELDFIAYLADKKGVDAAEKASAAKQLAQIEGLKQLAVKGKLSRCVEWIRDFIEIDGKLVVFAVHHFTIDTLMKEFRDAAVKLDGRTSQLERASNVDSFQNDEKTRLFVGNVQAAGLGITLTAASNVAFIELPWTPGEVTQAEDRCHRIGQHFSVNIHYLLAADTVEERIAHLIDHKRRVLDRVLDGKFTEGESLITELIRSYRTNNQ